MPALLPSRIPVSTYRVQLNREFTLRDAAAIVPYLAALGITDLYCSPILTAAPGSAHGYDICDYTQVNPELGGDEALQELSVALKAHDMGLILDFVPNHMGIDETGNSWWRDVLENGPSSPYARFFDIDWHPVKRELQDKLLLPILGDQYGAVLDRGELQLAFDRGEFHVRYWDHDLPLNPRQLRIVLQHNLEALTVRLAADDPHLTEFQSILFHLEHLPPYNETGTAAVQDRQREKEVAKRRFASLMEASVEVREHVERNIAVFNGTPGEPESFQLLHRLLEAQPYRLSFWHTATHEINYRRFFDINSLAGIRMEDPEVFRETHARVLRMIAESVVTGLRLDHVDGLFDPKRYFEQLHEAVGEDRRLYLVVEKILSDNESLRPDWAVHGTTGYEFLNLLNGVFVDRANDREFRKLYRRVHGARSFDDVVYQSKKQIIETAMASELHVLAQEANRISESDAHTRDFTLLSLQDTLTELVACFPVYRTYVNGEGWDAFDRRNVDRAVQLAQMRNPVAESSIYQFVHDLLLPSRDPAETDAEFERKLNFAMKVQQYTSPVQAKGVEDTAFYRYCPLLPLNEVGGHPSRFGSEPAEFHAGNRKRLEQTPLSMTCTSTHDTKCGEDGRARLDVLSEFPALWRGEIRAWSRLNSPARTRVGGEMAPDRGDEYLYYQALLAAWPPGEQSPSAEFVERMSGYMNKAAKEKKTHTSWITPSAAYDAAIVRFVEQTLAGTRAEAFLARFLPFQRRVAELGMVNSLAQTLLKIASPGVPDFYQGNEMWNLSLVDPDNRRPVSFAAFQDALARLPQTRDRNAATALLSCWTTGRVKQFVTSVALRLRREERALFLEGGYTVLDAEGARAQHVLAFARHRAGKTAIVVVPRLTGTLCGFEGGLPLGASVWGDTQLRMPPAAANAKFVDQFTGAEWSGTLTLANVLASFPVALLVSGEGTA